MTPRSLFGIVLKIMGLFLIKDMLVSIPSILAMIAVIIKQDEFAWAPLLIGLIIVFSYGVLAYELIFRSGRWIDYFKLDKNFSEESFAFSMHRSDVLRIVVIVLGGLILVDAVPELCLQLFNYWREREQTSLFGFASANLTVVLVPLIKLITGLLLWGNTSAIVSLIERKRRRSHNTST